MSLLGALALEGGLFAAGWAYHRLEDWLTPKPPATISTQAVQVPLAAVGSPIPLYFGKVRIRSPILAQTGPIMLIDSAAWNMDQAGGADQLYGMDQLYLLGIPFKEGVNRIHRMWAGELAMQTPIFTGLDVVTGAGNHEQPTVMAGPQIIDRDKHEAVNYPAGFGLVEFLNGNSSQEVVGTASLLSKTYVADRLSSLSYTGFGIDLKLGGTTSPSLMPGYRGYSAVFLFSGNAVAASFSSAFSFLSDHGMPAVQAFPAPSPGDQVTPLTWVFGASPQVPIYSFEASTYPNTSYDQRTVGDDANPADVIRAICVDSFGKIGMASTLIDYETFRACAETLRAEGHGYSRVIDQPVKARDLIQEITRQIDAVLWPDVANNVLKLKLVRADFKVNDLLEITPENCAKIERLNAPQLGTANRIKVSFTSRAKDYADDAATSEATATAGVDGPSEYAMSCPGITIAATARSVASRELTWRSIPQVALRAEVDRSFRGVTPGTSILLSWPELGASKRVFRVGQKSYGPPGSNSVFLDLLQDGAFVYRFTATDTGGLPSHPLPEAA